MVFLSQDAIPLRKRILRKEDHVKPKDLNPAHAK
jgi:hypothetical protein